MYRRRIIRRYSRAYKSGETEIEKKGAAGDISTSVKYRSSELGSMPLASFASHDWIWWLRFGSGVGWCEILTKQVCTKYSTSSHTSPNQSHHWFLAFTIHLHLKQVAWLISYQLIIPVAFFFRSRWVILFGGNNWAESEAGLLLRRTLSTCSGKLGKLYIRSIIPASDGQRKKKKKSHDFFFLPSWCQYLDWRCEPSFFSPFHVTSSLLIRYVTVRGWAAFLWQLIGKLAHKSDILISRHCSSFSRRSYRVCSGACLAPDWFAVWDLMFFRRPFVESLRTSLYVQLRLASSSFQRLTNESIFRILQLSLH